MDSGSCASNQRYWLLTGSTPSGPFTIEEIHAKLAAGEAAWDSKACSLGDNTWLPLVQMPGIGPVKLSSSPVVCPNEGEFALPPTRLSAFGNLVCVYCLAINPFLWFASNLTCCLTGTRYKEGTSLAAFEFTVDLISRVLGLGITIALAWGGERLRRRGLADRRFLQFALASSITFSLVCLLAGVLLIVAAEVRGEDQTPEMTPAATVISFFMFLLLFASFAFEIAIFVWRAIVKCCG